MATINDIKEQQSAETPLLLFQCTLVSGDVHFWSTHNISFNGNNYLPRILQHNALELRSSSDDASDGTARCSITLANADGYFSPVERTIGWKGAQLSVVFLFYDYDAGASSDSRVIFRGIGNAPDESNDLGLKLTFTSRLNFTRIYLPETSVQKLCPWAFPATADQRAEALNGTQFGRFSPLYRCGYSADIAGGCGSLNGTEAFTSCNGTRSDCVSRGMFSADENHNVTAHFGGVEFVPPSIAVRTYRDKTFHLSTTLENQASYNDAVPLIYGTGWYEPLIVFARNDGNLTHMEVLLGAGEISGVVKVVVNNIEVPAGVTGANMTATGWYNVVSRGGRNGAFNYDFTDANGAPLGDPYGSTAYMSVVIPNAVNDGNSLPSIQVLIRGLKVAQYDATGTSLGDSYSSNPVWVLLDVLRRSGWTIGEIDVANFSLAAATCDQPRQMSDPNGNTVVAARYQCNLMLTDVRSASDVVRGIRNGSGLFLNYSLHGLLQVTVEDSISNQQPNQPDGTNSTAALNGGWPAYEFGDGSVSGIALATSGQSSFRTYARSTSDTPNRFTIEFQDQFNDYQQDSFTIVDSADITSIRQTVSAPVAALGVPNYDQAARISFLALSKSIEGNTYIHFETSVKCIKVSPGDIVAVSYSREGFSRQTFRVLAIEPQTNYRRVLITAQLHDDAWYSPSNAIGAGIGRQGLASIGTPRPLIGTILNADGTTQLAICERVTVDTNGVSTVALSAAFNAPAMPSNSAASVPLVSLDPLYATTGGAIPGATTFYYAVSANDQSSMEGPLSFTISATTPGGAATNCVTLQDLSFSTASSSFNVYRGQTPANLLRIASNSPLASQFTDCGSSPQLHGPPDGNFDHGNFYWRFILRPEQNSDIFSSNTIGISTAGMQPNEYRGAIARITSGSGTGQERTITSNADSIVTVAPGWDIHPDATSEFLVADASWKFGATGQSSPVTFDVPNEAGAMVQVSGRAANVHDDECMYELSPLTTWKIGGGSSSTVDEDVPAQPTFGISATGQGGIEVVGIGFSNLDNTRSIAAGTLSLVYWDEIAGASPLPLVGGLSSTDATIALNGTMTAEAGDVIQIDSELFLIQQSVTAATSLTVSRGEYSSTPADHTSGTSIYLLARKTFVMPFPSDFFGTSSSGTYSYRTALPDVRIAAADFYVTNMRGNSSVLQTAYTSTTDQGIRTLSGGQVSLQVEGLLAVQTSAAPPLIMDASHSVRDIFANIGSAPEGAALQLQVTRNGQPYCQLSIPDGATNSDVVNGAPLPALQAQDQLGLDILSVPQTAGSATGADLTVTIRL